MSNYQNTKATIAANVYTNHNNEVTAEMVKAGINAVVDTLIAGGFIYKGVAHPGDAAVSPDANVFYIASEAGTYTNKGGLVVADGEVCILKYNGSWSKEVTGAATAAEVSALGHKVNGLDTKINGANVSYDNSILIVGAYINSNTGEEVSNDYRSRTGFIEIVPGATIQFTAFGSLAGQGYALYDSSKTYVSGQDYTDGAVHTVTMVVPANVHYIRISFVSSSNPNFSSFSFVENLSGMEYDVATLIEEVAQIGEDITGKEDKDIILDKSINIFDGETLVGWMLNGALNATKTTWRTTTNAIPVEYGKTYYCTGKNSTGDRVGVGRYVSEFDADGNVISHTPYIDTDNYTPTSASVKSIKWSWQPTENGYSDPSVDMEIMVFEFGVESKMVTPSATMLPVKAKYYPMGYINIPTFLYGRYGAKVVSFGDSITDFGFYPEYACKMIGATPFNMGFGGCRLTNTAGNDYAPFSMEALVSSIISGNFSSQLSAATSLSKPAWTDKINTLASIDFSEVDYVTIAYGVNDFSGNVTIATMRTALGNILSTLKSEYPKLRILVISPMYRRYGDNNEYDSDTYQNANGDTLKDVVTALGEVAKQNHIEYLDFYYTLGINNETWEHFLVGSTHPDYDGYRLIGQRLAGYLISH